MLSEKFSKKVTVIIPALNEERTIKSIIEVVLMWPKTKQVIVVDDGSTDETSKAVSRTFGKSVILIKHKKNFGQGAALASGLEKATGDIILFIDADVLSLTRKDLDTLVKPLELGTADMTIAILRYWRAGNFEPFSDISGTRAVFRKSVLKHLNEFRNSAYGITVLINDIHRYKRVIKVRLPYVFVLGKFEKQTTTEAIKSYLKESRELIKEALRHQTGDFTPYMSKIVKGIQKYLNYALDAIQ